MSRNMLTKRGDRRQALQTFYQEAHPEWQYFSTHNLSHKLAVIDELEGAHSSHSQLLAGDMSLECAFSSGDLNERAELIDRARVDWENCLDFVNKSGHHRLDQHTERAARQLIFLPHYNRLLMLGEMPEANQTSTREAYDKLMLVACTIVQDGLPDDPGQRSGLVGSISELSVIALLNRFTLQTNTTHQFAALPSFVSQDLGVGKKGAPKKPQWDVSVYTRYDESEPILLTYKIQVKSKYLDNPEQYDDDIDVVYVRNDLSPANYTLRVTQILQDCLAEYYDGNPKAAEALDGYTDKLLDLLD